MTKYKNEPVIFRCGQEDGPGCGHLWQWNPELPMEFKAFIARMEGESVCSKCGQKVAYILLGEKYRQALIGMQG